MSSIVSCEDVNCSAKRCTNMHCSICENTLDDYPGEDECCLDIEDPEEALLGDTMIIRRKTHVTLTYILHEDEIRKAAGLKPGEGKIFIDHPSIPGRTSLGELMENGVQIEVIQVEEG